MASIFRAGEQDSQLISRIGGITIVESHGHSAPMDVVDKYISEKFNFDSIQKDLGDPQNIYHLINHDNKPAGYSKIILNYGHPDVKMKNVTMLERLYLLKEYHSLKLGLELLQFNIEFSKDSDQSGMWLYVWKGNLKAVSFYEKNGFKIIGSFDFNLTESHSNPNHHMFLEY